MPKGGGGRIQGVYHQKNRTKQTTAKGKQKGSNAVLEKCPKLSLPAAIDTMTGLTLHYDLGGVVPPRTSSTSAFELAAASNRIRRRWASRYCFHCEKQVAETHPRFRCCGACRAAFTVAWTVNANRGKPTTDRVAPLIEGYVDERATSAALSREKISPPSPSAAAATRGATAANRARSPTGRRATRGSAAKNIKIYYNSPRRRRSRSVTWCL